MLTFPRIPVLRIRENLSLMPKVEPMIPSLNENPPLSQPQRFMQVLLTEQNQLAPKQRIVKNNVCMEVLTVRYRNARGQYYEMQFDLWMRGLVKFEAEPHGSLLRRKVDDKPGLTTPIYFSVLETEKEILHCATLYEAAKAWSEKPRARTVNMIGCAPFDEFEIRKLRVPETQLNRELEAGKLRESM
ncbi:MAG: hypothetical protein ACRD22_13820 [Terriglobia bacterium]